MILTILVAQAPSLQLAERGSTQTAHAGILAAARAIVRDLQSHHTLSKLLLPDSEPAKTHEHGRKPLPDCRSGPQNGSDLVIHGTQMMTHMTMMLSLVWSLP